LLKSADFFLASLEKEISCAPGTKFAAFIPDPDIGDGGEIELRP